MCEAALDHPYSSYFVFSFKTEYVCLVSKIFSFISTSPAFIILHISSSSQLPTWGPTCHSLFLSLLFFSPLTPLFPTYPLLFPLVSTVPWHRPPPLHSADPTLRVGARRQIHAGYLSAPAPGTGVSSGATAG
jgi:hypothetical protein